MLKVLSKIFRFSGYLLCYISLCVLQTSYLVLYNNSFTLK